MIKSQWEFSHSDFFHLFLLFLLAFGDGVSFLRPSQKMKKSKRRLTVDPFDFEPGCDYIDTRRQSNQVKSRGRPQEDQENLHSSLRHSDPVLLHEP